MGALSGALSGAAAGSAFGPIGTAIGGIGGGLLGLFSGNKAAKTLATGNINAEHGVLGATGAAQNDIQQGTANYYPFVGAGQQGLAGLEQYAGSNPRFNFSTQDYFNAPAYEFQLRQGENAITNAASAMGLGASGNTLRDLTQYGQGLASQYYNQAFNQAQQQFQTNQQATLQNLQALINAGEFGSSGAFAGNLALGQTGMAGAQQAGQYAVGAAGGQAGGALNAGNQYSSILGGLAPLIASFPGLTGGNPNTIDPNTGLPSSQTP